MKKITTKNFKETHQPCPCGKSSDAYAIRDDGSGYCFSCGENFNSTELQSPWDHDPASIQIIPMRGHSRQAEEFYKVKTIVKDGKPWKRVYSYPTFKKIRIIDNKTFYSEGNPQADLFGFDLFTPGQSRICTIVEGEEDALSVFEMLYRKYPVYSVRTSASAKTDCKARWADLNKYDKIVLCFDNDTAGRAATQAVAGLFDFNKVYECRLTRFKDANDYEQNGAKDEFQAVWHNAKRFLPEGVISSWSSFDDIIRQKQTKPIATFPIKSLQEMSYGIRPGEITLLTALEGIGKTEVVRFIEYHILKTTDLNIGCIHLEENHNRLLRGLAGYELQVPCHLPENCPSDEEISRVIRKITQRDDRLHLYGHFDSNDPDYFLDQIRFLVSAAECRVITLDHIQHVVTCDLEADQVKTLDYLSNKLEKMVEDLGFHLILVSHVNDEGATRGSKYISKCASLRVALNRDLTSSSSSERNITDLLVLKNRVGAQTGPAGKLIFDPLTFMLSEVDPLEEKLPPA